MEGFPFKIGKTSGERLKDIIVHSVSKCDYTGDGLLRRFDVVDGYFLAGEVNRSPIVGTTNSNAYIAFFNKQNICEWRITGQSGSTRVGGYGRALTESGDLIFASGFGGSTWHILIVTKDGTIKFSKTANASGIYGHATYDTARKLFVAVTITEGVLICNLETLTLKKIASTGMANYGVSIVDDTICWYGINTANRKYIANINTLATYAVTTPSVPYYPASGAAATLNFVLFDRIVIPRSLLEYTQSWKGELVSVSGGGITIGSDIANSVSSVISVKGAVYRSFHSGADLVFIVRFTDNELAALYCGRTVTLQCISFKRPSSALGTVFHHELFESGGRLSILMGANGAYTMRSKVMLSIDPCIFETNGSKFLPMNSPYYSDLQIHVTSVNFKLNGTVNGPAKTPVFSVSEVTLSNLNASLYFTRYDGADPNLEIRALDYD